MLGTLTLLDKIDHTVGAVQGLEDSMTEKNAQPPMHVQACILLPSSDVPSHWESFVVQFAFSLLAASLKPSSVHAICEVAHCRGATDSIIASLHSIISLSS